jgi:hypothetical protein
MKMNLPPGARRGALVRLLVQRPRDRQGLHAGAAQRQHGDGAHRARSHCRVAPPLIHSIPDLLTYSVPLFLKRPRTLGALPHQEEDGAGRGLDHAGRGRWQWRLFLRLRRGHPGPRVDGARAPGGLPRALALSLCTTAYPLHTIFAKILGTSISETTMRPNPRSAGRARASRPP